MIIKHVFGVHFDIHPVYMHGYVYARVYMLITSELYSFMNTSFLFGGMESGD